MTRKIAEVMDKVGGKPLLLFSAHGLPQSFVDKGDTYQNEMRVTMNKIKEMLDLQQRPCTALLAFQVNSHMSISSIILSLAIHLHDAPSTTGSPGSASHSGSSPTQLTCASPSKTICRMTKLAYSSFRLPSPRTTSKQNLKLYDTSTSRA